MRVSAVGAGTLTFADTDVATLDFTIDGMSGSKTISRQMVAKNGTGAAMDYTGVWWSPDESGWSIALMQQTGTIFITWYAFDADGKPVWYEAPNCLVVGSGCSADLFQVSGGSPLTAAWNGSNKVTSKVGWVSFAFSDPNNGTMSYSLNGVAGARSITCWRVCDQQQRVR
jgi:hypothetical protein